MISTARSLFPISCRAARYSIQLPNKLYSYKSSTLALIPKVLTELKNGPVEVKDLFLVVGFRSDFNASWAFPEPTLSQDALLYSK